MSAHRSKFARSFLSHISTQVSLCLIFLLVPLFYFVSDGRSVILQWSCLALFYVFFARAVYLRPEISPGIKTYASIEILFLTFYYIIFYLPYQFDLLGLADLYRSGFLQYTFLPQTNKAVVLSTIGVVGFSCGVSALRRQRPRSSTRSETEPSPSDFDKLPFLVLALQIILMSIYVGAGWRTADVGRYTNQVSGGAVAEGIYLLIVMLGLITIGLWVNCQAKRKTAPLVLNVCGLLVIGWAVKILFDGDRNNFFMFVIAFAGGLATFRFRTPAWMVIGGIAASLLLYNGIESFRMLEEKSMAGLVENIFSPKESKDIAYSSFNNSTLTLRATLAIVPETHDHTYGAIKLIGIAGIIPLIRGVVLKDYSGFLSSADLITYYVLGPSSSWNIGSNVISDIYIDFGVPGVAILSTCLGLAAAWIQRKVLRNSVSTRDTVLYLVALPLFAELPRYSLDFPIRMIVWTFGLLFIYKMLFVGKRSGQTL